MKVEGKYYRTIEPSKDGLSVTIIDQTALPLNFNLVRIWTLHEMQRAIKNMLVRGAPLIGVCGAYGIALACKKNASNKSIKDAKNILVETRPTAINLVWAINKLCDKLLMASEDKRSGLAWEFASNMAEQDVLTNQKIGDNGLSLLKKLNKSTLNILTHCNAGWLATIDYGTALSPIYRAIEHGMKIHVWVDETRPRNQGMSLTAWELEKADIPHTVIADNTGGLLMQRGMVDCVLVGADRIGIDGTVCNKIGTYLKALPAKAHNIPFYVAAPISTFDKNFNCNNQNFEIEERDPEELFLIRGFDDNKEISTVRIGKSKGYNPAFDITPPEYITRIICEEGSIKTSDIKSLLS